MDALNIAAWQTANPHAFLAIELALSGETLRLTSGGTVTFNGQTWVPEHDDYGLFSYIGAIQDGDTGSANAPDIGFEPFTDGGMTGLTAAEAQGSAYTVYWGLVNPASGAVIGAPVELFTGRLNVSKPSFGESSRSLTLTTYTEEQFQLIFEGVRLANHSVIARTILDTIRKIYWMMNEPRPAGGGGGGGGGGTRGGGGPGVNNEFF